MGCWHFLCFSSLKVCIVWQKFIYSLFFHQWYFESDHPSPPSTSPGLVSDEYLSKARQCSKMRWNGKGVNGAVCQWNGTICCHESEKKANNNKKIILLPKAVSVFFWLNFYGENTQSSKSVVLTGGCQRQDVSWTGEGWDNGGLTQENIHFKRRFWGQFHSPKLSPKSGIPLGAVRWVGAPPGPKTVHSWSSLTSSCKEMAEFVKHMFTISCMLGQDYFAFCFRVSRKKMTFCIFFAAVHDSIPYNCLKTSVKFFITCCNIFRENC